MPGKNSFLISGAELLSIHGVELSSAESNYTIKNVSIDSRNIKKGDLFIAVKGDKFDGHDFVASAMKNGAKYCAVNKSMKGSFGDAEINFIYSDDTTRFLGDIARIRRNKLRAKVIGITGSNGKTTVKDILTALLKTSYKTVSTNANDNNHIGVPLTIFRCTPSTEMLVLEMGTNHFGEIPYTANIGMPDISLISCIGDSHLEYLINRKGVLKEKKAIFDAAEQNGGTIFLNTDDPLLKPLQKKYNNVVTLGLKGTPHYTVKYKDISKSIYPRAVFRARNLRIESELTLLGGHNIVNTLMAVSIAHHIGVSKANILKGLKTVKPAKHRLNLIKTGKSMIIDDTYNANPGSMESALNILSGIKTPFRKTAILGDMFELGSASEQIHASFSAKIKKMDIDEVLVTGSHMRSLFNSFNDKKKTIVYFETGEMLKKYLASIRKEPAVYLVKGSRGMRMEQYISSITGK